MEKELEVLQKTDHPHIVRVMELLEDNVNYYTVSEVMKGGELYRHIVKEKRLTERSSASIIKQILLALNYMHKRNIVHRDLKPENLLMVGREDKNLPVTLKIADFGFSCFFDPK